MKREIFIIKEQMKTKHSTSELSDFAGEEILGTAYEKELQRVIKDEDATYQIANIIQQKRRRGQRYHLVKWKDWPSKFNSWDTSDQLSDI